MLEALDRVADWMVEGEDMRHWRLWLNALDEAHRDDFLAEVMNAALRDWHRLIANLMSGLAERGDAKVAEAEATAWCMTALMNDLAGATLVKASVVTPEMARELMKTQMRLERGHSPCP